MTPYLQDADMTLEEMRDHAKVALSYKPVSLVVELLAKDVLTLCDRLEAQQLSLLPESA